MNYSRQRSAWPYALIGFAAGVACGMLYEAWTMARVEPIDGAPKKRGWASRVLAQLPKRVQLRAAIGAATQGTKEAARELKHKVVG